MKLKDFILQTLKNRLTMLWLESGPYTLYNSATTSGARKRINLLLSKRLEKWNLQNHFSQARMLTHHSPNWYPKYLKETLPPCISDIFKEDQLCYCPTYHGNEMRMDVTSALFVRTDNYAICKITGLQFKTDVTTHSRTYIHNGRNGGHSPQWLAIMYLIEWPDGSFKDTAPNGPEGHATDMNGVGGYHAQHRPWSSISYKDKKVFGIELETLAPCNSSRVSMANEARQLGMLAERDGSLAERGLEIIAAPMTYDEVVDTNGPWYKWIETAKAAGFTAWYALNAEGDPGGYGMHVNLNRRHFDPLHLEKLIYFINSQIDLSRKVAGRSSRQYALLSPKILGNGVRETDKYQAVAVRSAARVEVRIYRATMRWEGFLRNVEFTDAAIEFTRICANDSINSDHFLKWLDEQKKYPNLQAFLPKSLTERYQLEI